MIGSVWVRWVSLGPIPVDGELEYIDWPGLSHWLALYMVVNTEADNCKRTPLLGKGQFP